MDNTADLDRVIAAYEGQIRAVQTTLTNDDFYHQQVAFLEKRITDTNRELDALLRTRTDGPVILMRRCGYLISILTTQVPMTVGLRQILR